MRRLNAVHSRVDDYRTALQEIESILKKHQMQAVMARVALENEYINSLYDLPKFIRSTDGDSRAIFEWQPAHGAYGCDHNTFLVRISELNTNTIEDKGLIFYFSARGHKQFYGSINVGCSLHDFVDVFNDVVRNLSTFSNKKFVASN